MNWFKRLWDFVDERDIDKHTVCVIVLYGTKVMSDWAMMFASLHPEKSGVEVAAIIAAVTGPYMILQGACIKYYFNARTTP
jgi:hypothetical protein